MLCKKRYFVYVLFFCASLGYIVDTVLKMSKKIVENEQKKGCGNKLPHP